MLRFGVIADVQYADVDDEWNFAKTQRRRYRSALDSLKLAVRHWLEGPQLHFIADLGDMIDQQCETRGDSLDSLRQVLASWTSISEVVPVLHLLGNHELYNFNRAECAQLIPNITPWYRSFRAAEGWRVLVLDPYDLNVIEKGGGPAVEEGLAYLSQHNPNDLRAPRGSMDLAVGLEGMQRRFLPMGGAMREEQLHWLERELKNVRDEQERAIVLTHLPLHPESTVPGGLLWNYEDALRVLRGAGDGVVALVLAGHYHSGGYVLDAASGTHHVTLPSPLHTAPEDPRAHGIVEVWSDRVELLGYGLVPSLSLPLRPLLPRSGAEKVAAAATRVPLAKL